MREWAWLLFAAWLWPALALAQANVDGGTGPPEVRAETSTAAERAARLREMAAAEDGAEKPAVPTDADAAASQPALLPGAEPFTEETQAAFQKAWQAYYAYRTDGYTHRQRVFEWQDYSTKIIFAVVIFLVLAGVYFAAVQFHVGMRAGRETGESGEVELSVKGLKVRSPVLGVIVLTISLAFFYLYLIYVYPIVNVF